MQELADQLSNNSTAGLLRGVCYGRELSDLGIGEFVDKKLIRVA
jgi:hypothetical protein